MSTIIDICLILEQQKNSLLGLADLKISKSQRRINVRIERLANGNMGEYRNLKGGIFELKIDYAGGYRLYGCVRKETTTRY